MTTLNALCAKEGVMMIDVIQREPGQTTIPRLRSSRRPSRLVHMAGRLVSRSTLAFSVWSAAILMGQSTNKSPLLQRDLLPSQLRAAVDALGDRVVRPGKERVTGTGVFTKGTKQTAIRVTHELPNKVRIEYVDPTAARSVAFDGDSSSASDQLSDDDLDTVESFSDDSAESTLYGLQNGYSLRVLGEHFRTDRSNAANYQGPWLAIFELFSVTKQRPSNNNRQKYVVFDSNSRLLLYVRYKILRGSSPITVQTEWSGWRRVNGQSIPSRISRRENGTEVWSFLQDQATISPAQPDGAFNHK